MMETRMVTAKAFPGDKVLILGKIEATITSLTLYRDSIIYTCDYVTETLYTTSVYDYQFEVLEKLEIEKE